MLKKYKIISDSMCPLIPIGSEIEITKIEDYELLRKFDILLFKQDERLVCHYFWNENKVFDKGYIVTRCLKYERKDYPFPKKNIIGVVTNFKINSTRRIQILIKDFFR